MATHFAVEIVTERSGYYADFYRVSGIYLNKGDARKVLRAYVRNIDRSPLTRQLLGAPENVYINSGPDDDPGYFAPKITRDPSIYYSRY